MSDPRETITAAFEALGGEASKLQVLDVTKQHTGVHPDFWIWEAVVRGDGQCVRSQMPGWAVNVPQLLRLKLRSAMERLGAV